VVRQRRVQKVIRQSFRVYILMLRVLGVISLRVEDVERLADLRGKLIIANHPTLLDIVLLMSLTPRAQCIVKYQLWSNFFLRPLVQGAGYIRNDQDPAALLESCAATLRAGNNLIIFPEGTRSKPGLPIRFHRGFANIATMAGVDVQLVTIGCKPPMLAKGDPWYRIPAKKSFFTIAVGELVDINAFLSMPYRSLAARRLHTLLEHRYADASTNGKSRDRDQAFDRASFEARGFVT
jgi:1-acyl-sn-glycerol-3-phosphate acyltransferase